MRQRAKVDRVDPRQIGANRLRDPLLADPGAVGQHRAQWRPVALVDPEARRLLRIEAKQILGDGIEQRVGPGFGGGIGRLAECGTGKKR